MSKNIFIAEAALDDFNVFRSREDVIDDEGDDLNEDDVVIEYQEVRRFKVSKPKVSIVEIKSNK